MALLTTAELAKQLRQGELSPVYFLYGQEIHQMEKSLAAIVKKAVEKDSSLFNYQRFDGTQSGVSQILEAADAYLVMAERKCVTVSNLNIEKIPKEEYDLLKDLVKDPPETTVLIFHNTMLDINPKKSSKYKTFLGLIEKSGTVTEFGRLSSSQLEKVLIDAAVKSGCQLSPYLAQDMIARCGDSLSVLLTEIEKLCCFTGSGEITKEAVDRLTAETVDSSAFDLSKAILKREYDRAFHILSELFYQRIEPLAILGALNLSFSAIYKAAAAKAEQNPMNTVIADFGYKGREFQIKNAFRDVGSFSMRQIRQCIAILSETDVKLKSSRTDQQTLLEIALAKMMTVKEAAR